MAGGAEFALRPKHHLLVAGLAAEANAFGDQATAESQAARGRFHQQEAQLANGLRFPNQEDSTNDLAVFLCNPATLALGIEILDEVGNDFGDQRFEAFVIPIFLRVECTVAMDHPPHVAGLMGAQQVGRFFGALVFVGGKNVFDHVHGRDELLLAAGWNGAQHGGDLLVGTGFERGKHLAASSSEAQKALSAVGGGSLAADQAAAFEVGEDAAQVSGVEA